MFIVTWTGGYEAPTLQTALTREDANDILAEFGRYADAGEFLNIYQVVNDNLRTLYSQVVSEDDVRERDEI